MKLWSVLAAAAGLGVIVLLIGHFGLDAVTRSLLAVGLFGFALICLIHLGLIAVMGVAWRALLPGTRLWASIWGRLMRDSGAEVLPLSQVGGYVLGARAVVFAGVSGTAAAASTIVDVTLEFLAQLAYTALALWLLLEFQPQAPMATPVALGLVAAIGAGAAFMLMQRHGFGLFDRLARLLGHGWAERTAAGAAALHTAIGAIYERRTGLLSSFTLHLGCWIASAIEVWLALRFAGQPLSFGSVLVIESLLYATRTIAFMVPNAIGVQEGAYVLIGASFGLGPEMALAVSLLKRARDFTIGVPALGTWQLLESGRLWRRPRAAAGPQNRDAPP